MPTRLLALLAAPLAAAPALAGTAAAESAPARDGVVLVRGDAAADALTAGSLGRPLLLVPPGGALPDATAAFLAERSGTLTSLTVVGGEAAVSSTVLAEALRAAGLPG